MFLCRKFRQSILRCEEVASKQPIPSMITRLHPGLLFSRERMAGRNAEFRAVLDAHGTYNTFQFVLRLSPEVHRLLGQGNPGITTNRESGFDRAQAFSTLLHETVHWWQHVGSTYGLMLSLTYPTQLHANYNNLKELIQRVGFKKDIRKLAATISGPRGEGTLSGLTNIIINNHFDFGAFRDLTLSKDTLKRTGDHPMFVCVGHAFEITYGNNLHALASTVDQEHRVVPDPRPWQEPFDSLRHAKVEGFHRGSKVYSWPIGAREIFEGQACFAQLQYLAFASGGNLTWNNFRDIGMLHGIYEAAFRHFLDCIRLPWPPTVIHPTTALFLLICDMALNPGSGFPFPVGPHYASFIADVDPAHRFSMFAFLARAKCPEVQNAIQAYSREEYEFVSETLAREALIHSPLAIALECTRWTKTNELTLLMEEYRTFRYVPMNVPIRVLFSHFLAFIRDKYIAPEFFCWPGSWMAGVGLKEEASELFERHSALFLDKEDDDSVFPRLHSDKDEALVQEMFELFYSFNVTYDLVGQWIKKPGPFTYNFSWLSSQGTMADMKEFADRHFKQAFGVSPDDVELL